MQRHDFLIRRLHSLLGLVPVGAYLCVHLLTNAGVLAGPARFQENVNLIHTLEGVALIVVEWTFIFLPILFHGIFGFVIIANGKPNNSHYRYASNYRYLAQRVTGIIAFIFIFYHIWQLHWLGEPLGGGAFDPHAATSSMASVMQSNIVVQVIYTVGILSAVFHLANGIWTSGITWGLWVDPPAQKRADYVCGAFGVLIAAVGLAAQFGFMTVDIDKAKAYEAVEHKFKHQLEEEREAALKKVESGETVEEVSEELSDETPAEPEHDS